MTLDQKALAAALLPVSDERLEELRESYEYLAQHADNASNGDRAASDAQHLSLITELQRHRERVCRECEGRTFVPNPAARYERDHDGCEYTVDPEEIECPRCNGVGYQPPYRKPVERLPQVERVDGEPF